MEIKKATRKNVFIKMNISGPSGSGKTTAALRLAMGMTSNWDKIGVIDTENKSASLYSDMGGFSVIDLEPPFSPERYSEAIDAFVKAGFECLIVDSSSHEWNYCLEANDKLASAKFKGNTWSAWSETTPRHDAFVNKVLQSKIHIITCTRSKTDTVMGEDKKVKKVGMKDVQRDGWEYELTLSLNLDRESHLALPTKDRTRLFEGKDPFMVTEDIGIKIKSWCDSGIPVIDDSRQKPKMTENALIKAIIRIEAGEHDVLDKVIDTYSLTELQIERLTQAKG